MADRTELQRCCEDLERDLVSLTNLIQDIQVCAAKVNAQALLHDQPTINFQIHGPDLREHCEAMFDQLSNIEAWKDDAPPQHQTQTIFEPKIMETISQGFAEATRFSGKFQLCFEPSMDEGQKFSEAALAMHGKLAYAVGHYKMDSIDHQSNIPLTSLELGSLLQLCFGLSHHLGIDLAQAYLESAKRFHRLEEGEPA